MKAKVLILKINMKKQLLNLLLNFLAPTNLAVIFISQNLDKSISNYQKTLYIKYKNNKISLLEAA